MMIGPAPDESPISGLSENSHIMAIRFGAMNYVDEFGLRGHAAMHISRTLHAMDTRLAPLDLTKMEVYKDVWKYCDNPSY